MGQFLPGPSFFLLGASLSEFSTPETSVLCTVIVFLVPEDLGLSGLPGTQVLLLLDRMKLGSFLMRASS